MNTEDKNTNNNGARTEIADVPTTCDLQPATGNESDIALREDQGRSRRAVALGEGGHLSISIQSSPLPAEHRASCIAELPTSIRPRASRPHVRNGKIARLPKLERDMVNRMLHNNIAYSQIVEALEELQIQATERNISNWKTRGGYKEWCDEQERQLQLSHLQDHLTDYIRKNNATQLPEAGLQVAATQLSLTLLQPDAARQLAADPQKYSQIVDMLCRLSTHINTLQKDRDRAVAKTAIRGTSEFILREDEKDVEIVRSAYTSKFSNDPNEPEIRHRNDLPKRDELPYPAPSSKPETLLGMIQELREVRGLPAPQSEKDSE